ncbi:S-layer homology domain-containing protein [Lysinibacillus sp. 54212]|uniref:S-layer homology domain-containing protein n=1 Tax=Lysinibacillus sp. 54212 TaxID=3119829 RepID=UPI002FC89FC5
MIKKIGFIGVMLILFQLTFRAPFGHATVFENQTSKTQTTVSPGVTYIQEKYQSSNVREVVNMLDVNLNSTYTSLELGVPNPINSLKTTTALAKANNYAGHRVVGATNASFFFGTGYPANLLAQNNEIMNYGVLGEKNDSPTQQPVAFGISKSGKAIADYYKADLSFTVDGTKYAVDRINSDRGTNKVVLYTSDKARTGTNEWGVEIIVTGASQNTKTLHFGDSITGTVSAVTQYGQQGNSAIPGDGFVISIQNKDLATKLSKIQPDTPIQIDLGIDSKWMDAEFILAAGPLLVKDGKVNISMPTNSGFVTTRSDRTAVAVDATGTRVFLVTVDGRQSGYSNGTNLKDLASLLISKGASAAINLDGGGSTTMAVRQVGGYEPLLVNRPSGGAERRVSAILQVINSAPAGKVKAMAISGVPAETVANTSYGLKISKAYDEYLNPISINPANVTWKVEGGIGKIEGSTFTATTAGSGKIIGTYDGLSTAIPVKVKNPLSGAVLLDSFDSASLWKAEGAKAKVSIANASSSEPFRQGKSSLKLSYDFTTTDTGTKAAYAVAKTPIAISGLPKEIGVWVNDKSSKHWLRGIIVDGAGKKHTIDFTAQGGMNWTGWKYVTAKVPTTATLPIKFERIYITEPTASLQNKGIVYFDKLQAVYSDNYVEPIYTDVKAGHWAYSAIIALNDKNLIKGYPNGTYMPDSSITRAEAASIIARALNLKNTKNPPFTDVPSSHFAYNAIAAVAEHGIITGREKNKFSPEGKLTRAEMASILTRAYNLSGTSTLPFTDVPSSHWAYGAIQKLYANKLAGGYPDNTFRPNNQISRAEFASLLNKVLKD